MMWKSILPETSDLSSYTKKKLDDLLQNFMCITKDVEVGLPFCAYF